MSSIEIDHIIVHAKPGGQLDRCVKESLELAIAHDMDVILFHNDNEYRIVMEDVIKAINLAKKKK
jgi:hypothetical protein